MFRRDANPAAKRLLWKESIGTDLVTSEEIANLFIAKPFEYHLLMILLPFLLLLIRFIGVLDDSVFLLLLIFITGVLVDSVIHELLMFITPVQDGSINELRLGGHDRQMRFLIVIAIRYENKLLNFGFLGPCLINFKVVRFALRVNQIVAIIHRLDNQRRLILLIKEMLLVSAWDLYEVIADVALTGLNSDESDLVIRSDHQNVRVEFAFVLLMVTYL